MPVNTHAIVSYKRASLSFITDCWDENETPTNEIFLPSIYYSQEVCMAEHLERRMFNICGCHFIAGDYYPRNDKVCTPLKMKNCSETFFGFSANEVSTFTHLKNFFIFHKNIFLQIFNLKKSCKRSCKINDIKPIATFHNLDHNDEFLKNTFTVLPPNTDLFIWQKEYRLFQEYTLMCEIGGLLGTYIGLSIAAIVHDLALIIGTG